MKIIFTSFTHLAIASFLVACAVTQELSRERYTSFRASPTEATALPQPINERLAYFAKLLEVGYEKPEEAVEGFAAMGMNVDYFSPQLQGIFNYPEVFLLSTQRSDELTLIFVGTDSAGDWFQNIKTNNYFDTPKDGEFFVPSGHGGFRTGVHNLIRKDFFTKVLPEHIEKYQVRRQSKSVVNVTLAGHSQGGGIAQLIAPLIEGYKYENNARVKQPDWPYTVRAIYAYAPPYAVAIEGDSWRFMTRHFGARTWQVIRDNDVVSAIYNAGTNGVSVANRHFGNLVRITRDDKVIFEHTDWGSKVSEEHQNKPHNLSGYRHALEAALQPSNTDNKKH